MGSSVPNDTGARSGRARLAFLVVAGLLAFPIFGQGPEGEPPDVPEGWEMPDPEAAAAEPAGPAEDASTPLYRKALEVQRSGKWVAARKLFREILEAHPSSVHAADLELRTGENALLGVEVLHESGPPARRIDVTVMGDGFTIAGPDQALQERWAKLCLSVLWSEKVFADYKDYFNFYFVRLASKQEGVDPQLSDEERRRIEERNKNKTNKRITDFDTALDCKAAGPQGQVMADRELVYKWLGAAAREVKGCGDDRQVIAFARFGILGMGGGGIANVGRPDRSVTVHEFGHSFVGLLDEYTGNPTAPSWPITAPNAATTDDPEKVPWAHFLRKKVNGVGVFEGGATFTKGVWRPARGCAMNSAGHTSYCPVCREAAVLRIYSYLSPVDVAEPDPATPLEVAEGAPDLLTVRPMLPKGAPLKVVWHLQPLGAAPDAAGPEAEQPAAARDGYARPRLDPREWWRRRMGGRRAREDRSAFDASVPGAPSRLGREAPRNHHAFPIGRLPPGRYQVTAQVKDETPYVLEDPQHLLEERVAWTVTVRPRGGG